MALRLIAGLGNPTPRYQDSRHNVGFMVVQQLRQRWQASALRPRAQVALWRVHHPDVLLAAPQTWMNHSGEGLVQVAHYHRLAGEQILVVHDELDFPAGRIRLKASGGHGGHNGLRSIIAHLGADFARLRVGIGRPVEDGISAADYVLARPDPPAAQLLQQAVERAAEAAVMWAEHGLAHACRQLHPG